MNFELHECIGMRIRRLSSVVDNSYRQILSEFTITENQLTILFVLNNFLKIEQGKIGEILRIERSTVSRAIKLLEKKCLVKRNDEYQPMVGLTKEGKALVKTLLPLWESLMSDLYSKLGDKGMKDLAYIEKKLL